MPRKRAAPSRRSRTATASEVQGSSTTLSEPKPDMPMNAWTVLLTDFLPDESARPALGLSRLDRDHTLRSLAHSMTHLSEEDIVSLLWADSAMCKRVTGYAKPFVNTQAVAEFLGRIRYYREQARDAQERLDAYDRLLTGDP
jgi:hypothetical protein